LGAQDVEMSETRESIPDTTSERLDWRAWVGLIVAPAAWAIHHQLGSNLSFAACDRHPNAVSLAAGAIGLLAIIAAGCLAWRAWNRAGGLRAPEADALNVFVPLLSLMATTLFGLTILVQLSADVILPSCFG
jgi:hypothetical protein